MPENANNVLPTAPDDAVFVDAAAGPANITTNVDSNPREIRFGDEDRTGGGVVNHSAGSLTATGSLRLGVGVSSSGTYNLTGTGTLRLFGQLVVGDHFASTGNFNVGGTSVTRINGSVIVGNEFDSRGVIEQTGGEVRFAAENDLAQFFLGVNGTGTYTMSGGLLRQEVTSDPGNQGSWNRVAVNPGSQATLNLSGGTISLHARTLFGSQGTATINQTGGIMEVRQGEVNIGDVGSTAVYNLSGGIFRTLNAALPVTVGQWDNANGTLNVSNEGAADFAGTLIVGAGQDPVGTTGVVNQTGGMVTLRRGFTVGDSNLATGTFNLSNGTIRQVDVNGEDQPSWARIGNRGTANFNISGGTFSYDARVLIGAGRGDPDSDAQATVTQTGGTFEVRRHELVIGDNGDAIYNISAGTVQTLQAGRPITVGQWDNSDSQLNVSATAQVIAAGNLNLGRGRIEAPSKGTVNQAGGTVTVGDNLNLANENSSQSGVYNLEGGVLDLTGGNIVTGSGSGTFNMKGGELRNANEISGNSATAAENAGTFVQSGGLLAVGATAGAGGFTSINGSYTLLAGGVLEFEIADGISDLLTVNNGARITLGGNINVVAPAGLSLPQSYTIISNNTFNPIMGFFSNAPDDSPFFIAGSPYVFQVDYQGGDGDDVVLMVVPEPGAGLLLLSGAAVGLLVRRRAPTRASA